MSFWNGSSWVGEGPTEDTVTAPKATAHRYKDWLATGFMVAALVALIVPLVGMSAATPVAARSVISAWSETGTVRVYNEANFRIGYSGTWHRADNAGHINGRVRFSNQAHAKASISFSGSGIAWIGPVGPTRGQANVYIDGKLVSTVTTYSSTFVTQRVLFKKTWTGPAPHRITIEVLGTPRHPTVALDAFVVRATISPVDTTVEPASVRMKDPRVALSQTIGPVGTTTVLNLSGFAGRTSGAIDFDGSTAGMPTYKTSADGRATVTMTIPSNAAVGQHQINTRDSSGASLVRTSFAVTAGTPAPTATPPPTATPAPTIAPTPAPTATPAPTPAPTAPTGIYDAVFSGDASGGTDVTSSLRSFLQSHNGEHVALAPNGVYKVTQLTFTASNLTVDFRGARLQASKAGVFGILKLRNTTNIVLNDPKVYGTGYIWADATQWEHGFDISGGSNITLNNPYTRNTRGDGIFTGYESGVSVPPTGVVINNPNIERSARNGIAPVGGQVTIRGGHIAYSGLHGIDFEPNDATEAGSIRAVVDGIDIRHSNDLPVVGYGYAISAGWGHLGTMKPSLLIQNVTGDKVSIVVMNTTNLKVLNNTSDVSAIGEIIDSSSVTFSGNVRITRL